MKILGTIAGLAIIFLSSCDKGTDAADIASSYAGTYTITDTTTYMGPNNQAITQYNSSTCTMTETSFTGLTQSQFPRLGCSVATVVVTSTAVSLANVNCGAGPVNFVCTRSGTTLYFNYDYYAGATLHVKGIAVKQ